MSSTRILATAAAMLTLALGQAGAATPAASGEWPTSAPESVQLNPVALRKVVEQIRAGEYSNIHSLLVARHGKLVVEEYFAGEDEKRDAAEGAKPLGKVRFNENTLHDMRSISKSVVSVLFGIAQAQTGKLDLDEPVLTYFPEYADLRTPERQAIKLRHVLSMTPGWEWDEFTHRYGDPRNSETAMDEAADPYRYVLGRPIASPPGTKFVYNGGTTMLLAAVIERATKTPLHEYARKNLFEPLGIKQHEWIQDEDGKALAASGLRLRPRDLAKIGQLYLQEGRWNGRAVVPAAWVKLSTAPQDPEGIYGFQWWMADPGKNPLALGIGYGGQRILINPPLDMVVVITAGMYRDGRQGELTEKILRSCGAAASW